MRATIDKAGRLVIPKQLRDAMGLKPGLPLEIDFVEGRITIEYAPVQASVRIAEDGLPILVIDGEHGVSEVSDEAFRQALEAVRDEGVVGRV